MQKKLIRWSDEELEILKSNHNKPIKELMVLLPNRTKKAIKIKCDKLNYTVPRKIQQSSKTVKTRIKTRINWTKSEIDILISCSSLEEALQKLPHCNEKRIIYKMYKLKRTFFDKSWTNEEEFILRKYYPLGDQEKIKELLPNRTDSAIKTRANILNLKLPTIFDMYGEEFVKLYESGLYPQKIAKIYNLSGRTVVNNLIKSGVDYKRIVLKGEMHPQWRGVSSEVKIARRSDEYKEWRKAVFERDSYRCVCCESSTGNMLEGHHIDSFTKYKNKRFDVTNGLTLCKSCHSSCIKGSFHNLYGTKNNTLDQLQEYVDIKRKNLNLESINIKKYINEKD